MAIWAQQGHDPFTGLTNLLSDFYNDAGEGSKQAFATYLGGLGLNPRAFHQAQGLFGDVNRGYGAYSLAQPDPTSTRFTDYLTSGGAGNILEQVNQLTAQQRNYDSGQFGGMRKMF